ncbi:hypothetical protein J005_04254 [Cryptococcus neoformans]|nr:hypothetical protein J005_04254 [Cryptococcus neoformans var. grubii]
MVYAPQRRHAMASLTSIAQILAYLQYLHSPSLLILIARLLTHIQIQVISLIPPSRSLQNLALMLTLINIVAGILHWLDSGPGGGGGGGGGMVLDFVGTRPFGLAWVWVLDVVIWGIHLLALVLSYINSTGGTHDYKKSAKFPYPDILLPPPPSPTSSQPTQTTLPFPFSFSFPFPWSSTSSKYGVIFQEDDGDDNDDDGEQEGDDLESGQHKDGRRQWGTSTPTSISDTLLDKSTYNLLPLPLPSMDRHSVFTRTKPGEGGGRWDTRCHTRCHTRRYAKKRAEGVGWDECVGRGGRGEWDRQIRRGKSKRKNKGKGRSRRRRTDTGELLG